MQATCNILQTKTCNALQKLKKLKYGTEKLTNFKLTSKEIRNQDD